MFISQSLKKAYIKVLETVRLWFNKFTVSSTGEGAVARLDVAKKRIGRFLAIIGYDVLREDFKYTLRSYLINFDCICFIIINGYDVTLFWGDLLQWCFCACTYSYGFQCAVRLSIGMTKQDTMLKLSRIVESFVQIMEREGETTDTVRKFAGYIDVQTKIISILFSFTGLVTAIYPAFVYAFTKEKILPIGVILPGLSDVELPGYALNYCSHILQIVLLVGGMTGLQSMNIMFLNGVCLMIEGLIFKIRTLGMQIYAKEVNKDTNRNVDMTEIVKLHQDILEFANDLESLFSAMFFLDVFLISFQIVLTLMVCLKSFWIPGFFIMISGSFMLLIDCGYGLFVEMKFEALSAAVYDLPWHLMTIKDRKVLLFILQKTQQPPLLTFGSMAYMNLFTFVEIYKKIYSYFMILYRISV